MVFYIVLCFVLSFGNIQLYIMYVAIYSAYMHKCVGWLVKGARVQVVSGSNQHFASISSIQFHQALYRLQYEGHQTNRSEIFGCFMTSRDRFRDEDNSDFRAGVRLSPKCIVSHGTTISFVCCIAHRQEDAIYLRWLNKHFFMYMIQFYLKFKFLKFLFEMISYIGKQSNHAFFII